MVNIPEPAVFVSHTHDDAGWVAGLAEELRRHGVRTFLRERDIEPGQVDLHEIEAAISATQAAILVLSVSALDDSGLLDEYAALMRQAAERDIRLIPVLHGPAAIKIPPLAGTRLWADFRDLGPAEHEAKVAALATVIPDAARLSHIAPGPGATVPPLEILEAARMARPRPPGPLAEPKFVVTYAKPDANYGVELVDRLTQAGLPAWSIADLAWGSRWVHEIRQRLRHALAVVVVMSPDAEESEDVEREILEGQWYGREFFPVLLRGDRNFLLASSWYFDGRGGVLPSDADLLRLRRIHDAHRNGRRAELPAPVRRAAPARVAAIPDGIPLRRLRAFLKEGELAHADLLTTSLLLAQARRLETGWMDRDNARVLTDSYLSDIDACWTELTGGKHGFQQQLRLYRLTGTDDSDFLKLLGAYGWREDEQQGPQYGERRATPKYHEFVNRRPIPAGFFPTLRNQQIEANPSWYPRWRHTVFGVHMRLRNWKR